MDKLLVMSDQLVAGYSLTRWMVMHLLREALVQDPDGKKLFADPAEFFNQPNGRRRVAECMEPVILAIIRLLDGTMKGLKKDPEFDYKTALKSREDVLDITTKIIPQYQTMVDGALTVSFSDKWKASLKAKKA